MCNNMQLTDVSWLKCQARSKKTPFKQAAEIQDKNQDKMISFDQSTSLFGEAAPCPFLYRPLEGKSKGRGEGWEEGCMSQSQIPGLESTRGCCLQDLGHTTYYILFFSSSSIRPLFSFIYHQASAPQGLNLVFSICGLTYPRLPFSCS